MKKILSIALVVLISASLVFANGQEKEATRLAKAATYPFKLIKIIVPYAAGGGADISMRLLCKYLEPELGQSIVISNVSGGSGTIGFTQIANAAPDGYTLGYFSSTQTNDNLLFEGVKYDEKSFTPIAMYSNDPHIIVASKTTGITNIEELIRAVKAKPGKYTFGLGGAWTSHDFLRIKLESSCGISFKRMVFQGGTAAVTAVAGGNCDFAVPFVSEALPQIEAGNVVPIAITSDKRFSVVPNIPTARESGLDFIHTMWRALVGPAGLSDEVVQTIDKAMAKVMANPNFQKEAIAAGTVPQYMSHAEFKKYYLDNHELYKRLIAEAQISK